MSSRLWKTFLGVVGIVILSCSILRAQELNIAGKSITLEAQFEKALEEYEQLSAEVSKKKLTLVTPTRMTHFGMWVQLQRWQLHQQNGGRDRAVLRKASAAAK